MKIKFLSLLLLSGLFIGAVLAAGSTVSSSYQSALLDQRAKHALEQQRILKEELARAQSLQPVVRYAQAQGYVRTGALSSLKLTPPLAQR